MDQSSIQIDVADYLRTIQKQNLKKFKKSIQRKNKQPSEKKYCGDHMLLPDGYTRYGTRYECLKKGVGVGLMIAEQKLQSIYNVSDQDSIG